MALYGSNFWKKTPFLKLLLAAIAGIIVQWHFQVSITIWWLVLLAGTVLTAIFFLIPFFKRFRFAFINGIITSILFFSIGGMLTWQKDIRNDKQWLGNYYTGTETLIVTVDEPPVEKTKSVKANATVSYLLKNEQPISVNGKIILYFKKDSSLQLSYGSQIIFKKPLQEIKNSGNPGGFDYKRYSLFQGITHQVYLKSDEFELLNDTRENGFRKFIYSSREKVLDILRTNIKGGKELGLAEALLIGYKDDLEQSFLYQHWCGAHHCHIRAASWINLLVAGSTFETIKKKKENKMAQSCTYYYRFMALQPVSGGTAFYS